MDNMELILNELRSINVRLDAMDKRLDAMDKRFDGIDSRLDTMDKRLDALEQGQKDMKAFILENNNAIAEIFTDALEYTNKKIDGIEYVTKSNLYDIALMKKAI